MQAWVKWWRRRGQNAVRHAWGLAPQAGSWVLVGLKRQQHGLAQVHSVHDLQPPVGMDVLDPSWLSLHLLHNGRASGGIRHRLNLALPNTQLQEGQIELPAELPSDDWPHEVQWEVSQALQLPPDAVHFDFEPDPLTDGRVQRLSWIACARSDVQAFKSCTRAAGWRLATVETEMQAAQRAVRVLQGGVDSLLTQAPQDWQFRVGAPVSPDAKEDLDTRAPADWPDAMAQGLGHILQTQGRARLVASGLALRAWQ
jgi:hypothetical protein